MTSSDWITVIFGALTALLGFVGWLTATFMRAGKILQEIKYMNKEVTTLTKAFDSQDKKIDGHEIRITKIEARHPGNTTLGPA